MTTHEYVARLNVIDDDKHLGITNRLILMNNLKREYIASLEAENDKLEAMLEKAITDNVKKSLCPESMDKMLCVKTDRCDCTTCWREFLMQETADGATQADLPVADATQKEET